MDVVGLPEFLCCMRTAIRSENDEIAPDRFLHELAHNSDLPDMRAGALCIDGTDIRLWATCEVRLSSGAHRITWRYEERGGADVIVCFTLAGV